jgi:hypothetical protein
LQKRTEMHPLFRSYMLAHMEGVLHKYRATRALVHHGQKGAAREALAASAVRPWFGPAVAIGTGIVIDNTGKESRQCDNVLYWPDIQPAIPLGGTDAPHLFPIEGVAAVVEVKSTLTTSELASALDNVFSACRSMRITSGAPMNPEGKRLGHPVLLPAPAILAFDSDVAVSTLKATLADNEQKWATVCVLGGNGGVYLRTMTGSIVEVPAPDDAARLLAFSVHLRDNIQDARATRGNPPLIEYVL